MIDSDARRKRLFAASVSTSFLAFFSLHAQGQVSAQRAPATPLKSGATPHTGKHMTHPTYNYVLDVDPNPYAYTVRVNDWIVSHSPGDANTHFSSTRLGLYLVEGQNTVSIHIAPPPKGVPPGHKFDVTVRDPAGTAAVYHWDPAKPHAPIPVQAKVHFDVPHLPLGPWAWQTAPKITLDAPTKAAINAHVKRLFDALNTKNADEATALFAPGNRDVAAMDGHSAAQADAASRANWVQEFSDPHLLFFNF